MRLTRPNVARLAVPPGKTEIIVFDKTLPGFGVRVRLGGKRTWIAQYRLGLKQRRVTLGTTDTLDGEEARRRAKSVLARCTTVMIPRREGRRRGHELQSRWERWPPTTSSASLLNGCGRKPWPKRAGISSSAGNHSMRSGSTPLIAGLLLFACSK